MRRITALTLLVLITTAVLHPVTATNKGTGVMFAIVKPDEGVVILYLPLTGNTSQLEKTINSEILAPGEKVSEVIKLKDSTIAVIKVKVNRTKEGLITVEGIKFKYNIPVLTPLKFTEANKTYVLDNPHKGVSGNYAVFSGTSTPTLVYSPEKEVSAVTVISFIKDGKLSYIIRVPKTVKALIMANIKNKNQTWTDGNTTNILVADGSFATVSSIKPFNVVLITLTPGVKIVTGDSMVELLPGELDAQQHVEIHKVSVRALEVFTTNKSRIKMYAYIAVVAIIVLTIILLTWFSIKYVKNKKTPKFGRR